MNQITLRKIPKRVDVLIRSISVKQNKSINKTIIILLEKALGLKDDSNKKRNLSKFSGTWSNAEFDEFEKNTKIFSKIDKEIWE
jgi:hypothetical protein